MTMAHIIRWHGANTKNQSSLRCLVKEISNSQTASRTKCIIKLPFRNKFQKCAKNQMKNMTYFSGTPELRLLSSAN